MTEARPEDDAAALAARVILTERSGDDLPEDYRDAFDREQAKRVAESLVEYLQGFAEANEASVTWTLEDNTVKGIAENGASATINVFGDEAFDFTHWPIGLRNGRLVFDLATKLDADHMITLARRFTMQGNIED